MADLDTRLRAVERAAGRARRAEKATADARLALRVSLDDARSAGATISELARRLGVSRQRVYAMLND